MQREDHLIMLCSYEIVKGGFVGESVSARCRGWRLFGKSRRFRGEWKHPWRQPAWNAFIPACSAC